MFHAVSPNALVPTPDVQLVVVDETRRVYRIRLQFAHQLCHRTDVFRLVRYIIARQYEHIRRTGWLSHCPGNVIKLVKGLWWISEK